jgi:tryptophanyl-tRNA synthetase
VADLQDPTRKMSTTGGSEQGTVYVLDDPETIRRKFKRAVADSGREIVRREDKPGISNLIEIMAVATATSPEAIEAQFEGSGYGDFKSAVAEAVVDWLAPVRERYEALRSDEAELELILEAGAGKARELAVATLTEVRDAMGVGPTRSVGSAP